MMLKVFFSILCIILQQCGADDYNGKFNDPCIGNEHCSPYSTCKGGRCFCVKDFVPNVDGKCVLKNVSIALLGDLCNLNTDCIVPFSKCLCKDGFMKIGNECVKVNPSSEVSEYTTAQTTGTTPIVTRRHHILQVLNKYPVTKGNSSYGDDCITTCGLPSLLCNDMRKCGCAHRMLYNNGYCIHSTAFIIATYGNRTIRRHKSMLIHGLPCNKYIKCNHIGLVCDTRAEKCKCASAYRIVGDFCVHENSSVPEILQKIVVHNKQSIIRFPQCNTHKDCGDLMSCEFNKCVVSNTKGQLYDPCYQDVDCHFPNAVCLNQICHCAPSMMNNETHCGPIGGQLYDKCSRNEHCLLSHSTCIEGFCDCTNSEHYNGTHCKPYGCTSSEYYTGTHCEPYEGQFSDYCDRNENCHFPGSRCIRNVCVCHPDLEFNGTHCEVIGSKFNRHCYPWENFCDFPHAMCIGRTCQCHPNFEYNGSQCIPFVGQLNDRCNLDEQCHFPYSMCVNKTCQCSSRFKYNGTHCVSIGDETPVYCHNPKICDVSFYICDKNFKCKCKDGFSPQMDSGFCVADGYYNGKCLPFGACNSHLYIREGRPELKCRRFDFKCVF